MFLGAHTRAPRTSGRRGGPFTRGDARVFVFSRHWRRGARSGGSLVRPPSVSEER